CEGPAGGPERGVGPERGACSRRPAGGTCHMVPGAPSRPAPDGDPFPPRGGRAGARRVRSRVGPRHARQPVPTLLRGIYLPRSMDAAAFAMTTYGIPLLVLATTNSAALTGAAFALEWIPRLGAFAVAGPLVDRHGTTTVLRLASAARAVV